MKRIYIFLGITIIILGCETTNYDYKTENLILECFYKYHKDRDIDVKKSIDEIEKVLLKHKILEDRTGNSYVLIIEKMLDNNVLDINNPDLIADIKSIDNIPTGVFCSDYSYSYLLDSVNLANSKLKYIIGIFDSIRVRGNISQRLIAEEILEVLDAKDFENDYYRTIGLIMFSNMLIINNLDKGATEILPPAPEQESAVIEQQNIFEIIINAENQIFIGDKPVDISELNRLLKEFIVETSDKKDVNLPLIGKQKISKGRISIQNEKETSYNFYITVQKEISKVYMEIRDNYSMKFFNSSFENLDIEKQEIIKDLVPLSISDAEPVTL